MSDVDARADRVNTWRKLKMENDLVVWTLDDASTHNLLLEIQRTTAVGYDEAKAVFDRLQELGFYVASPDVVAPEVVGN